MLTSLKASNVEDSISLLYNVLFKETQNEHNTILDTLLLSLYQGLQSNGKIEFVTNSQFEKRKGDQNIAYICEDFISLLLSKSFSPPNIQLIKRILERIKVDENNASLIAKMIENIPLYMKKDIPSVRMLGFEILSVFLSHEIVTSRIDFEKSRLLNTILKHSKSYPEVKISALNALHSIILCFGTKSVEIPHDYHYILMKIFKNLISSSERILEVRAAALRCASAALPQIITNTQLSEQFQSLMLKEMMISPAVGHVYGQFLSLSLSDESQVPVSQFQRSSLDINTPVRNSLNFTTIFEYICQYFNKYNRVAHRESLSKCATSFLSSLKFETIKTHINVILKCLADLLIHPTLKVNKNVLIIEAKSCVSYIIRAGIISKLTESQRIWFLESILIFLESLLEKLSIEDKRVFNDTSIVISCFLVEVEFIMGIIEENIINLNISIEKLILNIITKYCKDNTLYHTNISSVWVAAGIVLKKYAALNDKYDIDLNEKLNDEIINPIPLFWLFYCTKSVKSCNVKQFKTYLEKFKDINTKSEQDAIKHIWKISSWMLLSSITFSLDDTKLKLEKQSILKESLKYIQTFWDSTFHLKPDVSNLNYVTLEMIYALDALYNIIRVYDILSEEFITFITKQLKTLIAYLNEWKDPQTFNLMCTLIVPVLEVYNCIKDKLDSEDSALISKDLLKLLINFLINPKHNHSDYLIQQFLPIEDEILETKPKEYKSYGSIATKSYIDYHNSTYNFAHLLNYRWNDTSEKQKINFLLLSTSQYALYRSINTYHHLFIRNTEHQYEIITFFDSHIKELDDPEQQNLIITTFLLVFHCVTSNLMNHPQLSMSLPNLNLLMEKIVAYIHSPLNIHRRLSSTVAANICYLNEEIHNITAKRLLISIQNIADDCSLMGISLTLSKIHQLVSNRTSSYSIDTVNSICSILRKAIELTHHELSRYSLHCLFITLEAVGASVISQTKNVLKLITELLSKEFTYERRLLPQLSKIIASIIQIMGPELVTHTEYMEQIAYYLLITEIYGDYQVKNEIPFLYNSSEHERYTNGLVKGSFISNFEVYYIIWERIILFTNLNTSTDLVREKFIQQTAKVFSIYINEDIPSEILSMKLKAIQSLKLVVRMKPTFFEDRIFIHYILSLLNRLHPKSIYINEIYSILSILEDSMKPSKWISICTEYILTTHLTPHNYSKYQDIPYYFKDLVEHISFPDEYGLVSPIVAKIINNSIKLKSSTSDDIVNQNLPLYIKLCLKTLQSNTFLAISSGVELFCTITNTLKRAPQQMDVEKIRQFLLLFTNVMRYNISKENITSFKSFYCACYGYCQFIISIFDYFSDLSIISKLLDSLFSHINDTLSSTYNYWLIAISHLFQNSINSHLKSYLHKNGFDIILKDSWIKILRDFVIYDDSIIGKDISLIFRDIEFIKIGFTEVLLALTSEFVKDDPINIQFCLALILKSLSQNNNITKNLNAMSQLFETTSSSCIAPALLDHKNVVFEVFEACLGLFKRSGMEYNRKLIVLNTSKRFIMSILSGPEFNNHPEHDLYTNIACQYIQDIIEFEENLFKYYKPYSYMSEFIETISISWQSLQPTKEKIASLLLWMFNLPIEMNDYENINNNFYKLLLKAIKRIQSKNSDSFLHCQLNTALKTFKTVDNKLKDWYIGLVFTTLSSLKKDTGSVELHSMILSIFFNYINKNTLKSYYIFLNSGLKSQYVPLNALAQSYLGVLAPRITNILLKSLENGEIDPDLCVNIVNILTLLQKIEKRDRGLNNLIIILLIKLINLDNGSKKSYQRVHEISMRHLIKMSKENPEFKLCVENLSQSERSKLEHILNSN